MTVTWIDVPGSTLAGGSDPVDFVAPAAAVVSVNFGPGRLEEVAYRGGSFLFPYLQSTKVGDTFTLRRSGGWPKGPHVSVSTSGGAASWKKLYEVDFTALSAQTCAPGSHTVDGKTWWVKGLNVATSGGLATASVSPGNGLRITSNFHMCYPSGGTNPYLRWFMPLAQLSAFNEAAPTVLQARLKATLGVGNSAMAGFIDSANDTQGPAVGVKADHITQAGLANNGTNAASPLISFGRRADASSTATPSGSSMYAVAPGAAGAMPSAYVSIFRISRTASIAAASPWTGSFQSPDTIEIPNNLGGTVSYAFRPGTAAPTNLGVTLSAQDQAGGATHTYDLMQMCIWQLGAA